MFTLSRAVSALAGLAGLVLAPVLLATSAHAAVDPGAVRGASVVQTGWWNALNEPPPDNPLTPPPPPPAPDVPAGTLPVSTVGGDPKRISAIEIALEADPGSVVDKLELAIAESATKNVTANAEKAAIEACPVTELSWVGGENIPWKNRPEFDCEAGSAKGVRDDKGVWRFDLTSIASTWLAEDFSGSRSVMLVPAAPAAPAAPEAPDAPPNFQVIFDGPKAGGIGLLVKTTAGSGSEDDSDGEAGTGGTTTPNTSVGGGEAVGTLADTGDLGSTDLGGAGTGDLGAIATPAAMPEAAAPATAAPAGQIAPVGAVPHWHDGMIKPALIVLPPLLILAYLAMLSLGPVGQPAGIVNRRGVSQALDKLRVAGSGLASKIGR